MIQAVFKKIQQFDHYCTTFPGFQSLQLALKQSLPAIILTTYFSLACQLFLLPGAFFRRTAHYRPLPFIKPPLLTSWINLGIHFSFAIIIILWTRNYLAVKTKVNATLPIVLNFLLMLVFTVRNAADDDRPVLYLLLFLVQALLINLSFLLLVKISKQHYRDFGMIPLLWAVAWLSLAVFLYNRWPGFLEQASFTEFFSNNFFSHPLGLFLLAFLAPLAFLLGLQLPADLTTGATDLGQFSTNLNAVFEGTKAALPLPLNPYSVMTTSVMVGGVGATLGLALALVISRNQQQAKLGRLALIPSLFDQNGILAVGLPLLFRPIFWLPMTAVSLLTSAVTMVAIKLQLVRPVVFASPNMTPNFLLGFFASQTPWRSLLLSILLVALSFFLYRPVVRYLAEEAQHD
ncbi:hypothetical protein PT274_04215 [Leuconostocaceae bacterium ESL0958]|nr:hypothetical protein [Leuconostocaceae bacterium ESL0958]